MPWNEDAPFSVPPHLRDQHNTFEGLQAATASAGGGATFSSVIAPTGGVTVNSAEADNLLS